MAVLVGHGVSLLRVCSSYGTGHCNGSNLQILVSATRQHGKIRPWLLQTTIFHRSIHAAQVKHVSSAVQTLPVADAVPPLSAAASLEVVKRTLKSHEDTNINHPLRVLVLRSLLLLFLLGCIMLYHNDCVLPLNMTIEVTMAIPPSLTARMSINHNG